MQVHLDKNLAKNYDQLLKTDISAGDIFIVAWREMPILGDIKFEVLHHLENFLTSRNVLIYLSSVAVYGQNEQICTEDTPLMPINDYGQSKLELEKHFNQHFESTLYFLRISNVFGDQKFDDIVNRLISAALNRKQIHLIEPKKVQRDYISIDCVVQSIVGFVSIPNTRHSIQTYNISSGKSVSLAALILLVEEILRAKIRCITIPANASTITISKVSNDKFLQLNTKLLSQESSALKNYIFTSNASNCS
jgi:UDP-glucose 4-epimerase